MLIKVDVSLLIVEVFIHHLKFKLYFLLQLEKLDQGNRSLFVCLFLQEGGLLLIRHLAITSFQEKVFQRIETNYTYLV